MCVCAFNRAADPPPGRPKAGHAPSGGRSEATWGLDLPPGRPKAGRAPSGGRSAATWGHGFTLVEVMVALVIMSVLAVMAWQGVDGIVRARDASNVRLESTLRLGTVMTQWDQDIAAVQRSAAAPEFAFDGANMRITRRTDRGLQVVVWSLKPGIAGTLPGSTLMRWNSPAATTSGELQDSWIVSQQLQGTEANQIRVLEGISQWQVYCFRDNAWSNCQSSVGTQAAANLPQVPQSGVAPTPARIPVQMPTAIRLVLTFADGSGTSGTLTRDTRAGPKWQ